MDGEGAVRGEGVSNVIPLLNLHFKAHSNMWFCVWIGKANNAAVGFKAGGALSLCIVFCVYKNCCGKPSICQSCGAFRW